MIGRCDEDDEYSLHYYVSSLVEKKIKLKENSRADQTYLYYHHTNYK
jgi:hypothetical protein